MMKFDYKSIENIYKIIVEKTGGGYGIRDYGLLESSINSPFQSFDNVDLYPTIEEKASRIAFCLIKNHPCLDGNKRIGILAMLVFLEINNIILKYTDQDLINLGLGVAEGSFDYEYLLKWIKDHSKVSKSELAKEL